MLWMPTVADDGDEDDDDEDDDEDELALATCASTFARELEQKNAPTGTPVPFEPTSPAPLAPVKTASTVSLKIIPSSWVAALSLNA
jgi:hypothetical protein